MPARESVQRMFGEIASRYDFANDVLSLGLHRRWRKKAMRSCILESGSNVVDLCCGTGDFALCAAEIAGEEAHVVGVDFVRGMVSLAASKSRSRRIAAVDFICADAMRTPIGDGWADLVTIAFGIRNLEDPLEGLKEIERILAPGGRTLVLEFGQPTLPGFAQLFSLYSRFVIPLIGALAAGNRAAYEYLPRTSREFPAGRRFLALMEEAGFADCSARAFLSGVAYAYTGRRG